MFIAAKYTPSSLPVLFLDALRAQRRKGGKNKKINIVRVLITISIINLKKDIHI
tara:strand:- start:82 stop:243 length:162 start_codon:yes stop_codon:yes gene_type:complete